jgi:hypothetical protein
MMFSRHEGPGQKIGRFTEFRIGFFLDVSLALTLALAHPARAAAGDTLGGADSLPPPQTYIMANVVDSATGQPLVGAGVYVRNAQANFSLASTDSGGWAYVTRSGLPFPSPDPNYPAYWVTAGYPGYVSRQITASACGSEPGAQCVLRYALVRETIKNSMTFTGTLLDSASGRPIAGFPLDISHGGMGGWATYVSRTDDTGHFAFTGIPAGTGTVILWLRSPRRVESRNITLMAQDGKAIFIPEWSTTSLAAPRDRLRVSAKGKSASLVLFGSRNRDATGRWRD